MHTNNFIRSIEQEKGVKMKISYINEYSEFRISIKKMKRADKFIDILSYLSEHLVEDESHIYIIIEGKEKKNKKIIKKLYKKYKR